MKLVSDEAGSVGALSAAPLADAGMLHLGPRCSRVSFLSSTDSRLLISLLGGSRPSVLRSPFLPSWTPVEQDVGFQALSDACSLKGSPERGPLMG